MTAEDLIAALELEPHPEGGHFRETWRAEARPGERAAGTAIYFLLARDQRSAWHRIDSAEIWHYYAGAPLELAIAEDGRAQTALLLGPDLQSDQRPQRIVPPGAWQSARSLGDWTLVGCTVSPGFEFSTFEMWSGSGEPGEPTPAPAGGENAD